MATRTEREITVMVWNYHDDELAAAPAPVRLSVKRRDRGQRCWCEHYRIDDQHSNAYTVWKQMGSPQQPTPDQYARLEASGQLQLLGSPEYRKAKDGVLTLEFSLPRHAVSLVRLTW